MASKHGVKTLSPAGGPKPTGAWSLGARAGDFVFVAGMRGTDPKTNAGAIGDEARIRQAYLNMKLIAESEGATVHDCVRLVCYFIDLNRHRPIMEQVTRELWGDGPYPPRTVMEIDRLAQDDIFEVDGTFYAPLPK